MIVYFYTIKQKWCAQVVSDAHVSTVMVDLIVLDKKVNIVNLFVLYRENRTNQCSILLVFREGRGETNYFYIYSPYIEYSFFISMYKTFDSFFLA